MCMLEYVPKMDEFFDETDPRWTLMATRVVEHLTKLLLSMSHKPPKHIFELTSNLDVRKILCNNRKSYVIIS